LSNGDNNPQTEKGFFMIEGYSVKKTAEKTAPPIIAGLSAEIAYFACQRAGLDIPKDQLYQLSTVLLTAYYGLINWIKNRKKR
jgi:hypothetical protein